VGLKQLPPRDVKLYNLDYAIVDDASFRGNPTSDFSVNCDPRDATCELSRITIEKSVKIISNMVKKTLYKE
jgi:hypothetical protein